MCIRDRDILLYAVANLLKNDPSLAIKISFVGIGPSLPFLQKLTKTLALHNHVEFLMQKDRKWIYENLCNYDIPVSYTHLDVYKRQIFYCAVTIPIILATQKTVYL